MQYNPGAQLDPSQMGGGGRGRGGTIAVGGGASILIMILALLFGFNPGDLLGGGAAPAPGQTDNSQYAHCQTGADIEKDPECRYVAYTNSIQNFWSQTLSGYQATKTVTFEGAVNTACGQASAQVGPFYCPADATVYLDKSFFQTMLPQLGAQGGDAAATVRAGWRPSGPIIVNSSRAILYASNGGDFAAAARREAAKTRDMLQAARPL